MRTEWSGNTSLYLTLNSVNLTYAKYRVFKISEVHDQNYVKKHSITEALFNEEPIDVWGHRTHWANDLFSTVFILYKYPILSELRISCIESIA